MSKIDFVDLGLKRMKHIFKTLSSDDFFKEYNAETRFNKYKDFFNLYSELITNVDLKQSIINEEETEYFKMESFFYDFFSFIRNLLTHFPIYNTWDEVVFNKDLINWNSKGRSIDKFLTNHGHMEFIVIKNHSTNKETRVVIDLMTIHYVDNKDIYLKRIIEEKQVVALFLTIISEITYILGVKPFKEHSTLS